MTELNLHQKLLEIRKNIGSFSKDKEAYGYSYVSGKQVLSKIKGKMDELGVLLIPQIQSQEHETFDYVSKGKEKTDFIVYGKMTYTWVNAEKPEEKIEVPFYYTGQQNDISMSFGSGLTYSERYFLMKFFNVPTDEDDPDAKNTKDIKRIYSSKSKASNKQLNFVNDLLEGNAKKTNGKFTKEQLYEHLLQKMDTKTEMKDWTAMQASQAIKILQGKGE